MIRLLALAFCLSALGACSSTVSGPLTMVEVGTLAATQKSTSDHIFTLVTGMDCSSVYTVSGGDYCRPYEKKPETVPMKIYCYRSLAQVNCFTQPLASGDTLIGTQIIQVPVQ